MSKLKMSSSNWIWIEDYLPSGSIQESHGKLRLRDLLDISPTLTEVADAIVDDSFTRCFKSNPPKPWNWNIYLFPLWCLGVVVRYGLLFPLRAMLTIGWTIFLSCYFPVHFLLIGHDKLRKKLERGLVELICSFFVASWSGVIQNHGPRPSMRPKQAKRKCPGADNTLFSYSRKELVLTTTTLLCLRRQSFTMHMLQLMTSWAVCDVWYLEPQNLKPG